MANSYIINCALDFETRKNVRLNKKPDGFVEGFIIRTQSTGIHINSDVDLKSNTKVIIVLVNNGRLFLFVCKNHFAILTMSVRWNVEWIAHDDDLNDRPERTNDARRVQTFGNDRSTRFCRPSVDGKGNNE